MNERIRELAEQSGIVIPKDSEYNGHVYRNTIEKFAKLIIQECIKTYNDDGYQTEHEQDQKVLKHFGVES